MGKEEEVMSGRDEALVEGKGGDAGGGECARCAVKEESEAVEGKFGCIEGSGGKAARTGGMKDVRREEVGRERGAATRA